ncbi:unnamed protein product [Rotaria sordida]|uniref:SAM domain-containing protein n=1 Tax=Rotaria sordida TaxID=392033 RepID=A0A815DXM8_9BILA|nr:unnamed protein product [Rotaria sordida]CAF1576496.1 unnamed protein product [Rotaria sordida]
MGTNKQDNIYFRSYYTQKPTIEYRSTNKYINARFNLATWSINDVSRWLRSFDESYHIYIDIFRKDMIDGFRLFRYINDHTLKQYGINNKDHRERIVDEIQYLKQNHKSIVWSSIR